MCKLRTTALKVVSCSPLGTCWNYVNLAECHFVSNIRGITISFRDGHLNSTDNSHRPTYEKYRSKLYHIDYSAFHATEVMANGDQSGAAVPRLHGNHQDVGLNPATARNEKTHNGQTPAQKVPQ